MGPEPRPVRITRQSGHRAPAWPAALTPEQQEAWDERMAICTIADLTAAQAKAYRLADNATASLAEWDPDLLPVQLAGLGEMNFDLCLLGFDDAELTRWLNGAPAGADAR